MKEFTKREEEMMQVVWRLKKAFIREIIEELPEPKPHYNTVATIVKILVRKGYLQSELLGNTHQYSPTKKYEDYLQQHISEIKEKYFENSLPKLFAHFAKQEKLSEEEKEELIKIIKAKKS